MVRETHIEFDKVWNFINSRKNVPAIVQNKDELGHVFELVKKSEAKTYLEIGTAEGNSLYALGGLVESCQIINLPEKHTQQAKNEIINILGNVDCFYGDSTKLFPSEDFKKNFDVVMIDGGHDFATVLNDSIRYGDLAKKYIFWHDINLPEVNLAFEWYVQRRKYKHYYRFSTGPNENFGYGIMEKV